MQCNISLKSWILAMLQGNLNVSLPYIGTKLVNRNRDQRLEQVYDIPNTVLRNYVFY